MRTSIIVPLFIIAACCQSPAPRVVVKEQLNYRLTVPGGWSIVDDDEFMELYSPPATDGKSKAKIVISTIETMGKSVDEKVEFYLDKRYTEQFNTYRKIGEGTVMMNGNETRWLEHKFSRSGDMKIYLVHQVFTKDRFYELTAMTKEKYYEEYLDGFREIIDSFEILK